MADEMLLSRAGVIPAPLGLSSQARANLEALQQAALGSMPYPAPDDARAWKAFIEIVNQGMLSRVSLYARPERHGIRSTSLQLSGVPVYEAVPEKLRNSLVRLHFHGGGLVFLAGEGCRREGLLEAERTAHRTLSPDFRVPPDHPYPAALDDAVGVYRAMVESTGSHNIVVSGTSGGGNLASALLLRARDEGLPMPAGLILLTPELDLTESGDTFRTLLGVDPVLTESLGVQIAQYAGGRDLSHPYLSPLFGSFAPGWPPTLIQSGTRDLFLSNCVRMHRSLRKAGVRAELHVWEAMPHGGFYGAPEDEEVSIEVRCFMDSLTCPAAGAA